MQIRAAEINDYEWMIRSIDTLIDMYKSNNSVVKTRDELKLFLLKRILSYVDGTQGYTLIAFDENEPAGEKAFLCFSKDGKEVFLDYLASISDDGAAMWLFNRWERIYLDMGYSILFNFYNCQETLIKKAKKRGYEISHTVFRRCKA